ncbi:MAG: DUF4215 domain-containing protein [Nannocystis sp.]|nr:DUF4215 domain-containing protein [Nannocystis sp.]
MTPTTAPHRLLLALALVAPTQPACTNDCGAGLFEVCPSPATDSDATTTTTSTTTTTTTTTASSTSVAETTTTDDTDTTTTPPPVCGDGDQDPDEECDDGEANADDAACTAACKQNICGDGLLLVDAEECDDGEANADDAACTAACKQNICGDGLLLKDAEECDDQNTVVGDGCTDTCKRERYVFVSSTLHTGNNQGLKGLQGADTLCQELAQKAGLTAQGQTYMAWLSTTNQGPAARFPEAVTAAAGPFKLLNNNLIAASWAQLIAGPLLRPIDRSEQNQTVTKSTVWTNTTAKGAPAGKGDCDNWNSFMGNPDGGIGYTDAQDAAWTDSKANDCASSARLYCFQVTP